MSEKRYFKIEYDEEWYLFDSTTISEQLVKEQAEYGYGVFANSLSPSEICDRLNTLHQENISLKGEIKHFDGFAHNWKILYDEAKDKVGELVRENEQLKHYKLYEDNKRLQTIIADLKEEIDEWKKENRELLDQIQEFERIPKSIRELWVE